MGNSLLNAVNVLASTFIQEMESLIARIDEYTYFNFALVFGKSFQCSLVPCLMTRSRSAILTTEVLFLEGHGDSVPQLA